MNSLFTRPDKIEIGNDVYLGSGTELYSIGGIVVGNGVIFEPGVIIYTRTHNFNSEDLRALPFDNRMLIAPVTIGNYVWIARNVIILPGVTIGKGAVVGAGSVVSKDIPAYGIAVGNPTKIVSSRNKEIFEKIAKEKVPFVYTNLIHEKEFVEKSIK